MPQLQKTSNSTQNNIVGGILGALLDLAVPNAAADTQKQADAMSRPVNPTTNLHEDQAAALQGVLDKHDKAQAEEAFASMGPDTARQLLDHHYSTMPEQENSTATSNSTKANVPNVQGMGLLSKLLGMDLQPEVAAQRLANSATMQKLQAGQPAEIALPQAEASEIQQKISGAVPLQPKDIMDLNIASYSAALKANQDAYTNSNAEVKNLTDTLNILQQGRSTWGKAFGGNTEIMEQIKSVIAAKTAENQKIGKNQKVLMDNAPKVGSQESKSSGFKVIGVR